MAITKSWGYAEDSSSAYSVKRPNPKYKEDFAIYEDEAGKTVLTNLTSPMDQPETVRYQYQHVANIYNGSDVDPSFWSQNKNGYSVVVDVKNNLRVTDSEAGKEIIYPVKAHLVFSAPKSQHITAGEIEHVISRILGFLSSTDTEALDDHINSLMRSATRPAEM